METARHSFIRTFWKVFKIFLLGFLVVVITGLILSGSVGVTGSLSMQIIIKMLLGIGITWAFVYLLENIIFNIVGMQSRETNERLHRIENDRLNSIKEDLDALRLSLKNIEQKLQDHDPNQ